MGNLTVIENGIVPIYSTDLCQDPVVDGRELHAFLGVGRDFSTWITDRIEKYGFIEGEDFSPVLVKSSGRPKKEYALTLDMAKELSMVENNDVGRQVRKYFISVEKKLKELVKSELEQLKVTDDTKRLVTECKAFGLTTIEAADLIIKARAAGQDISKVIEARIQALKEDEIKTKRNRIYVRIQRVGTLLKRLNPDMEEPFEEAWHLLSDGMIFEVGTTKTLRKRHDEDKAKYGRLNATRERGVKKMPTPGYLDYIAEANWYKPAEKVVMRLIAKLEREIAKRGLDQEPTPEEVV